MRGLPQRHGACCLAWFVTLALLAGCRENVTETTAPRPSAARKQAAGPATPGQVGEAPPTQDGSGHQGVALVGELEAAPAFSRPPLRVDALGVPLPPGAMARLGTLRLRHRGIVQRIALSPDGAILASTAADRTLRLWDATTGAQAGRPIELPSPSRALGFVDRKHLVTGSNDGVLRIWNVDSSDLLREVGEAGPAINALDVRRSDGRVAVGTEAGVLQLRDLMANVDGGSPNELDAAPLELVGHTGAIVDVAWSPAGDALASVARDGTVRLWSADGQPRMTIPDVLVSAVHGLAWRADGTLLAAVSDALHVWNAVSGDEVLRLDAGPIAPVNLVRFGPTADSVLTMQGAMVAQFDLEHGVLADAFAGRVRMATDMMFGPDASTLYVADENVIRFLQPTSLEPSLLLPGHTAEVVAASVAGDGKTLVSAGLDGNVIVWNLEESAVIATQRRSRAATDVEFRPDGRAVAIASPFDGLLLWSLTDNQVVTVSSEGTTQVAFDASGSRLVELLASGVTRLRAVSGQGDAPGGDPIIATVALPKGEAGSSVAMSRDGERIAVGLSSGKVALNVLGPEPAQTLLESSEAPVVAVCFSSDGTLLAAGSNAGPAGPGLVAVWEVTSGRLRGTATLALGLNDLAFSEDGGLLVAAGADGVLRVLEVDPVRERFALFGHEGGIRAVVALVDGRRVATASADSTLMLWELGPLRTYLAPVQAATARPHESVTEPQTNAEPTVPATPDQPDVAPVSADSAADEPAATTEPAPAGDAP